MTKTKEQLKAWETLQKRSKSLLWRAGGVTAVFLLSNLTSPEYVQMLNDAGIMLPTAVIAFVGLVMGEITKWLNSDK